MEDEARSKAAALRAVPLFERLAPADVDGLAGIARELSCAAGETIFRRGDPGLALFVVLALSLIHI